ncbi:MAG: hypothetical protein AB4352_18615 [Hormoscilla sp.]
MYNQRGAIAYNLTKNNSAIASMIYQITEANKGYNCQLGSTVMKNYISGQWARPLLLI